MWIYVLIIFFVLLCTENRNLAKSKSFLFGFTLFLALFVGFGDMLGGYDRYLYAGLFDSIYDSRIGNISLNSGFYETEKGYMLANYLISFLTGNRYIFILIFTLLIYLVMFLSFKDYMSNYPIAILLFLALMFFFTFTYLRQVMAAVICWYSIRYVYNRNFLKFVVLVLIAASMHNSAFIFLVLYFIPIVKFDPKLVVVIMTLLLLLGLSPLPGVLFSSFGGLMGTENRVDQYTGDYDSITGGFRLDYIIEAIFFLFIILTNYNTLPVNKRTIVLQNTAVLFCGILLFFVRSSSGGRLSWYFMIGVIATITSILAYKRMIRLRFFMKIVCFILFFRIVFYWGILLSPYKTFFTNGHREGDYIFLKYEYDLNYDKNKFYR